MNPILISSDPFIFAPSGEDFISLDETLGQGYSTAPPENFEEFTVSQFHQTWNEFELLLDPNQKELFTSGNLYESDSGFSSSSGSPEYELDNMSSSQFLGSIDHTITDFESLELSELFPESFKISDMASDFDLDMPISQDFLAEFEMENVEQVAKDKPEETKEISTAPQFLDVLFNNNILTPLAGFISEQQEVVANAPAQQSRRKTNPSIGSACSEPIIFEENLRTISKGTTMANAKTVKPKTRVMKGRIAKKPKSNKKLIKEKVKPKMHELDPVECPMAKNAVAAKLRRERAKTEKTEMQNMIQHLLEENRDQKEEIQTLRQLLAQHGIVRDNFERM